MKASRAQRFTLPARKRFSSVGVLLLLLVALILTACDPTLPEMPVITVVITAVDDTDALAAAVTQAVGATTQFNEGQTATVMAQGGVTLTPSITPTPTTTYTPSPTRFFTATPTPVPTETATPTFAPYQPNTPAPLQDPTSAWLRVIHAWRDPGSLATVQNEVDVYINEGRVQRSLALAGQTNYYAVQPGAQRVTIRSVDQDVSGQVLTPPIVSGVVEVAPGGVVTVALVNQGKGPELVPLVEDPAPLPAGSARLTVLNANNVLLPVNLLLPRAERALAYNFAPAGLVGPFDVPSGRYIIDLYDAEEPEQQVQPLPEIELSNRVSYILVLIPPATTLDNQTSSLLFSGATRLITTDLNARFINAAPSVGPISIAIDGVSQLAAFEVGAVSPVVPISSLGPRLLINSLQGQQLFLGNIGPWTLPEEQTSDKLVILFDRGGVGAEAALDVRVISQYAPPSAINANIRLIHALPNTLPLQLEIRPIRTRTELNQLNTPVLSPVGENEIPWITVSRAEFAQIGAYASRTPDLYSVRVRLEGSPSVIGSINNVQMRAGGTYDFAVVPGTGADSARIVLFQPNVQLTDLLAGEGNATAVFEAVAATLTAQAPEVTSTPTRAVTPTATRTPVPTNTPRPSNTPDLLPPVLRVEPAPPNTTPRTVLLLGDHFAPGAVFTVNLVGDQAVIFQGEVSGDGTINTSFDLPEGLPPGAIVLRLCADCTPRGVNQEQFAIVLVADPNVTPTVTPAPQF
ncbi:MAG: DUF4397 domain-containing protein [Anaerolineae bacterium]|nr:DUF4397 domain-containing protein [Anaerolineae bacterium]